MEDTDDYLEETVGTCVPGSWLQLPPQKTVVLGGDVKADIDRGPRTHDRGFNSLGTWHGRKKMSINVINFHHVLPRIMLAKGWV